MSALGEFGLPAGGVEAALPSLGSRWDDAIDACSTKFRLGSGYGLFRRMTGVGDDGSVMRPEVILEGSDDGGNWTAIEFSAQTVGRRQGRADVGRSAPAETGLADVVRGARSLQSQHLPINLVYRLLKGEPEVWGLVDDGSRRSSNGTRGWGAYGADAGRDDGSAWAPTMIRGRRYAHRFVFGRQRRAHVLEEDVRGRVPAGAVSR